MSPKTTIAVFAATLLFAALWFVALMIKAGNKLDEAKFGQEKHEQIVAHQAELDRPSGRRSERRFTDREIDRVVNSEVRSKLAAELIERLSQMMLAGRGRGAIDGEVVLRFSDEDRYVAALEFFTADESSGAGLAMLANLDTLRAIRLGYDDLDDLGDYLAGLDDDGIGIDPNFRVRIPVYPIPDPEAPLPGASGGAPFGNNALRFLGVGRGENASWGQGVKVAVLDSGIAEHPTFSEGQVVHVGAEREFEPTEAGENVVVDGHGTAVASIIGGSDPRTPGVAPGVELLSFQLLDENGSSDSFTLAQMIGQAVEAGADIINLSVGSNGDSQAVRDMVAFAVENRVLVVASSGNDAADDIVFPAAYEGVVAVGAVDAQGEHLEFSNSGEEMDLAAPGLGVDVAWPNEQIAEFSGTSASAPFVSGAVAAVMSENPALSGIQAWELLQQFTNEAGAPGVDPMLGRGNLNIGRVMERDQAGIFDLAVTSHHFDPEAAEPGALQRIEVTVQNRGTEPVANFELEVNSSGRERQFFIPFLNPGDIITHQIPVDAQIAQRDGQVGIVSRTQLPQGRTDRSPGDNLLQSVIDFSAENQVSAAP